MTEKLGIIQEVKKLPWCVSIKIKINTAIYIIKLSITNYKIQPGDKIYWFEERPHIFHWTSNTYKDVKAELYQWGYGPKYEK